MAAGKTSAVVSKAAVGINLTSASKVQATAITASSVGVRSMVSSVSGDTLTIRLTGTAPKNIRVAWSVSNGTAPADGAEIAALAAQLGTVQSDVAALQSQNATQQNQITTLQNQNAAQQTEITALQTLLAGVTRLDVFGKDTIRFSGMNVQVVDGTGTTVTNPGNGLGNLVVGYNEKDVVDDSREGSHNLVVGRFHSYSSYGGLLAGENNAVTGFAASVTGGVRNVASGTSASVTGGDSNTASGLEETVVGGDSLTCAEVTNAVVCGEGTIDVADPGNP